MSKCPHIKYKTESKMIQNYQFHINNCSNAFQNFSHISKSIKLSLFNAILFMGQYALPAPPAFANNTALLKELLTPP